MDEPQELERDGTPNENRIKPDSLSRYPFPVRFIGLAALFFMGGAVVILLVDLISPETGHAMARVNGLVAIGMGWRFAKKK